MCLLLLLSFSASTFAEASVTGRFDAKTGDVKLFVDPVTNVQSAYCPQVSELTHTLLRAVIQHNAVRWCLVTWHYDFF